jgi:nudix-type nucleoside diphosphatase (YffH/AdpP family)
MSDTQVKHGRAAVVKRLRRVFSGFLSIDEALVSHPRYDGTSQEVLRLSLERGDSVAITLVDRWRRIIFLTEQFRFPTLRNGPGWLREIPAGDIKKNESAAEAARRETFEETGFVPTMLEPIATFYASPGGSSERIFLYFAAVDGLPCDAEGALSARDSGEDIAIIEQALDPFLEECCAGHIPDGKTLVAGLWLLAHRARLGL